VTRFRTELGVCDREVVALGDEAGLAVYHLLPGRQGEDSARAEENQGDDGNDLVGDQEYFLFSARIFFHNKPLH
jgi:hypothetical protein